ncbi:hypothetical protein [Micromonospora parathelypteridis]|uniref:Uncharacterized protein n=1 Tax=Micromonospora parathelypteridis TaxID=1839617 RepID=A0A840VHX1_9ACTN|nr:hypothetical protein [Micromonospora parathelypteridis]MBB5476473.1 hypothetical protein [Micromonospora parathelypteridis]GGO15352.1 hypothetical protein GCM10011576_27240 [Micromonospora parathelypteridis]
MTRAPSNLLAVRSLLLTHLNIDPNTDRPEDLEPAEVGIVGDPAHRGGYHCGSDRVVTNDYSVVESPRDKAGLTLDAAALDVGGFEVRSGGRTHTLSSFSLWCVGQCAANAADTRDIREIIYSLDGSTVKRWDRLGKRTTGDSSHRWHTHFSFFRDSTKAGRDQRPLFRRYLISIGLLEDDDMTPEEHAWLATVHKNITVLDGRNPIGQIYTRMAEGRDDTGAPVIGNWNLQAMTKQLTALQATVNALAGKASTDETVVAQGVLAGLSPEKIAAAIPPTVAKQVADELARRLVA